MGVLRYTQDGSTGASDGEEISDQWRSESDEASGEAAPHTHTHTHTHSGAHQCEWGQTGQFGRQKEPSIIGSTSSDRPEPTERRTAHPQMVDVDASQSEGFRRTKSRQYNKDPHVADYESAEEVMALFLNG